MFFVVYNALPVAIMYQFVPLLCTVIHRFAGIDDSVEAFIPNGLAFE